MGNNQTSQPSGGLNQNLKLDEEVGMFSWFPTFCDIAYLSHSRSGLETVWKIWTLYSVNKQMTQFQWNLFLHDIQEACELYWVGFLLC
jgi:hypothetical protein